MTTPANGGPSDVRRAAERRRRDHTAGHRERAACLPRYGQRILWRGCRRAPLPGHRWPRTARRGICSYSLLAQAIIGIRDVRPSKGLPRLSRCADQERKDLAMTRITALLGTLAYLVWGYLHIQAGNTVAELATRL